MFATACKKSPSTKIYNTWSLVSVEMPDADSTTIAKMMNEGVTYTFKKGGDYSYTIGGKTANGTFEINKEGTSMTTSEGESTSSYNVTLSETDLTLADGEEKMIFTVKK